jgi:hypothetical protein
MIISASRRTDIPAFFAKEFKQQWDSGTLIVPKGKAEKTYKTINTTDVDCVVYWTKNPRPLMELGFPHVPTVINFTITSYGTDLEPQVPRKGGPDGLIELFKSLARRYSPSAMQWRYDPILYVKDQGIDFDYHVKWHKRLCEALSIYSDKCIFSFVSIYGKLKSKFARLGITIPEEQEQLDLITQLVKHTTDAGMTLESCCDIIDFTKVGAVRSHCIDGALISALTGKEFSGKDWSQRKACGCIQSVDIGSYHTCKHGCVYCYA